MSWPTSTWRHSDGDGVDAKGKRLWTLPSFVLARGKTPPPHIRRRGTCWAGQAVLWALGTHEDEERRALGKVDLLQTAERSQCRGAGVMDRPSCTQDGVAAGQQGLPQRRLPSRLAPGARCCRLRGEGLGSIPRYCRNRLAGLSRSRRCLSPYTTLSIALLLRTACDYLPEHSWISALSRMIAQLRTYSGLGFIWLDLRW